MKNIHVIILLALILIVGCKSTEIDPRPPLMDTNSFSNFTPMVMSNDWDEIEYLMGKITNNASTNAFILTNGYFNVCSSTGSVFRFKHSID